MDRFLGHLPLRTLTLHDSEQVASFLHQLRALEIEQMGTIYTVSVWRAMCNLTHLSELRMKTHLFSSHQIYEHFPVPSQQKPNGLSETKSSSWFFQLSETQVHKTTY